MRKMTKTVVTLAAMSAMTAAAASMAFAATNSVDGLNAVKTATEAKAAGANSGTWSGDNKEGWTFTTEDGIKLKDTWAEIDGVWYYFHKDGKMAQDEIIYLDGESYFFADTGAMATGWQQIKSDMDAYGDVDINDDLLEKHLNLAISEDEAYDYYDHVWCYFFENGAAAENEWVQSEAGLWYYFDGNVMVRNVINYAINPDNTDHADSSATKIYGFDKNGAMLTGWNYLKSSTTRNDPTADAAGRTWFYYNSNGQMQKKGWKKIDGEWYLFANDVANKGYVNSDGKKDERIEYTNAFPLIVNTYVESYPKENADPEYFYVDTDGKMQTGIVTLPKNLYKTTFYQNSGSVKVDYTEIKNSGKPEIYFGTDGAATEKLVSGRYYTLSDLGDLVTSVIDDTEKISNTAIKVTEAVSGGNANVEFDITSDDDDTLTKFYGRVIKNAFIGVDDDTLYLADKNGDIVTYKAVLYEEDVVIGQDKDGNDIKADLYVLFDRYGEAYTGYDKKDKSVVIGGKTYWSMGEAFDRTIADAEVSTFIINK